MGEATQPVFVCDVGICTENSISSKLNTCPLCGGDCCDEHVRVFRVELFTRQSENPNPNPKGETRICKACAAYIRSAHLDEALGGLWPALRESIAEHREPVRMLLRAQKAKATFTTENTER